MKKIIATFLVAALLFSGCSLFKKDPQKAVEEGLAKFADVKKMTSLLTLKGMSQDSSTGTSTRIEFDTSAAGKSDVSDDTSPKIDVTATADVTTNGQKMSLGLLLRTVDKKIFLNLNKFVVPGQESDAVKEQLASVVNTWWSMPYSEGNSSFALKNERDKLNNHLKNSKIFTNAREDGQEEIQGVKTTRYRVDVNKDELKKLIVDIARTSENALTPEEDQAIADSLKEIEFSAAIWIGDDDIMHKISGTITITPKQGATSSFEIDYKAWDFGANVDAAAPTGAQEFDVLKLYPLLGAFGALDQGSALPVAPKK